MEEIELSEQCRLGNNRARKELYEQYAGRMLGICLRYTGDSISAILLYTCLSYKCSKDRNTAQREQLFYHFCFFNRSECNIFYPLAFSLQKT